MSAVLGCGSNVVDHLVRVAWLPTALWSKTLATAPATQLAGGVVFNQLAWAASFGVPVSLLAAHPPPNTCAQTRFFRTHMARARVDHDLVVHHPAHVLGKSHVFLHAHSPERFIVMHPGSTRTHVTPRFVEAHWAQAIAALTPSPSPQNTYAIVTAEISQLQFATVAKLAELTATGPNPKLFFLDIDLEPLASAFSQLDGDVPTLTSILKNTSLAKVSRTALHDILSAMNLPVPPTPNHLDCDSAAQHFLGAFIQATGCRSAALTRGGDLSPVLACRGTPPLSLVARPPPNAMTTPSVVVSSAPNDLVDATGAGDAFMGGLIAHTWRHGLPTSTHAMQQAAAFAEAAAKHCCSVEGALPPN